MYTIRSKEGVVIAQIGDEIGKEIIMKSSGTFEEKELQVGEWIVPTKCFVLTDGCTYGVGKSGNRNYMSIFVWPKGYIYKGSY